MTAASIISNLYIYHECLRAFQRQEESMNPSHPYTCQVRQSYDTIEGSLFRRKSEENGDVLHLQLTFAITGDTIVFRELYTQNPEETERLTHAVTQNPVLHQAPWKEHPEPPAWLRPQVIRYLSIADRIAFKGMNQYSGDGYRPGYYSSIELTEEEIILSQINHMNSRSLAHKENYSLRDLRFYIPLDGITSKKGSFQDQYIDAMRIDFSDHSAAAYRSAGDAIQAQIREEGEQFKNGQ